MSGVRRAALALSSRVSCPWCTGTRWLADTEALGACRCVTDPEVAEEAWRALAASAMRRYLVRIGYPPGVLAEALHDADLIEVVEFLES